MAGTTQEKPFPTFYRVLLWLVFADVVFFTARVWVMVYFLSRLTHSIPPFLFKEFAVLVVGYHCLVLVLSVINLLAHYSWRMTGSLNLYPVAILVCTAAIDLAAVFVTFSYQSLPG
jgi:hypothetical protein